MQTTIEIFKMTDRKTLERSPIDKSEISKVIDIVDPKSIKGGLGFPLPDVFGAAGGNMDIAICARACDGERIQVAVPTGQRHLAHNLG
jgi:hypothetical protein